MSDGTPSSVPSPDPGDRQPGSDVEPRSAGAALPFQDLDAPEPLPADPPEQARWLAFAGILIGGLLGGLIGFGVGDLMGRTDTWAAVGALIGGVSGAIGVGIIATLTLRAMNEWNAVEHPEDSRNSDQRG